MTGTWSGGFKAEVTVTNTGDAPIGGWTVAWDLGTARIASLWSGVHTLDGSRITVTDASWNGALSPGATAAFGYTADGTPPGGTVGAVCAAG
ncbi:cellulose binding domain-containing protein [Streptomyces sp. NPDC049881]|uniref:cellulose binding domain-containing protein n=1 Tax=Streptomyces sp. NPDC049881 TaxID=3155778 RepID=UPI003424E91F